MDATNRYMQRCNFTIVVAKVDRPENNTTFKRLYTEAFRRRRSGSVIMVITRSDDLNLQGKTRIEQDPQDEERLSLIVTYLKEVDQMLQLRRSEMEKNRLSGETSLNDTLREQTRKLL